MKSFRAAVAFCAALCIVIAPAIAQTASPARPKPVVHHQVSNNPLAQAAFDRGLLDYYAYNPEAAEHEFYAAADLDSHLAMAWWGIALSNAPNLNVDSTDDRDAQAAYAIERAQALESYATAEDRAFIDAAVARFADSTKAKPDALLAAYAVALQSVAKAHPNDPDAAALALESALYVADAGQGGDYQKLTAGQQTAYVARVAALLPQFQTALAQFPQHPGLLHFYIHAAQQAGNSSVAVGAAQQLAAFDFPLPDSHLTHMPGHTFFDEGMYREGLDVGQRSVAMDFAEIDCCHPGFYSAVRYYHNHNVSFVLYALTQTGKTSEAVDVAKRENNETFLAQQLVADRQWKATAALPADPARVNVTFARGLADAKLGDRAGAQAALAAIPPAKAGEPYRSAVRDALRQTLSAEIALLDGKNDEALALLESASASADAAKRLGRPEMPVMYFYSPHMALAELALRMGKIDIARAALQAELVESPKSSAATAELAKVSSRK